MVDCGCAFCTGDYSSTEEHFEGFLHYPEEEGLIGFWRIFTISLLLVASLQIGVTLW